MNRKLIVTLLRKDIQELDMITEGFMEMTEYPKAILSLAQRKSDDIQSYIKQLAELKTEIASEITVEDKVEPVEVIPVEVVVPEIKIEENIPEMIEIQEEITEEVIEFSDIEENTEITEIIEVESEEELTNTITEITNKTEIHEVISITNTETRSIIEDNKKTILADRINTNSVSRNDAMSRADNSISNTLANKKIDDIKQAINIGDRFRFQRELFRGNGEDMNKTLTYINQLATLAEVQSFLQSKYNWENGSEAAEDFYQIVKRRFL